MPSSASGSPQQELALDPEERLDRLFQHLRTRPQGLSSREASRRLETNGPNELVRRRNHTFWLALIRQLVNPLALLLWLAALLSVVNGSAMLGAAIVVVILLNAALALVQEHHAEQAVEALATYLPPTARVMRDEVLTVRPARELVPGDVIQVAEGERISADARVLSGVVSVDMSMLTGESVPVVRSAAGGAGGPLTEAPDLLFSGTACTQGDAVAVVLRTGMHTEIGRIAALSQRVHAERSPLETQVNRAAKVIGLAGVALSLAFIPIGTLAAGLSVPDAISFAIGLLVANVPEGLLPTITLALAVGVRVLARDGALVKRISAVETLGSTSVICTDKTGTLTLNQMQVQRLWTVEGESDFDDQHPDCSSASRGLLDAAIACSDAEWANGVATGDPTEVALLHAAEAAHGGPFAAPERLQVFPFDPALRRMTTVDRSGAAVEIHTKGAPEDVLPRCIRIGEALLDDRQRAAILEIVAAWADTGLRVLAVAERAAGPEAAQDDREAVESDLTLLGLVGMIDPPRPSVADAVARCHQAGIRLVVISGDHALTARGIARRVGIGDDSTPLINGSELDTMTDSELDRLLAGSAEVIFARSSPEAKLRIADALHSIGVVSAMTGDGVNDAPALRRADIGIAMGKSGTDVAREASTMVLTNDDFSDIVTAVESGRRVYDNVRKFIVYVFAHATPEVVPFLVYALSGGRLPLPLTVMQILAIDLGTETLPALALGREPAEPGLMDRPPRRRGQNVVDGHMLWRAWGLLGGTSAILVTSLFVITLLAGGWHPGDSVDAGPLHAVWQQATTMCFLGICACQLGAAMASRTQTASLRQVGLTTNPLLLWGMAFNAAFAAVVVLVPPLESIFGTRLPAGPMLLLLIPLPVIVWGVDEFARAMGRRRLGHR